METIIEMRKLIKLLVMGLLFGLNSNAQEPELSGYDTLSKPTEKHGYYFESVMRRERVRPWYGTRTYECYFTPLGDSGVYVNYELCLTDTLGINKSWLDERYYYIGTGTITKVGNMLQGFTDTCYFYNRHDYFRDAGR